GDLGFKGFALLPPDPRADVLDTQVRGILRAMFANGIMDRPRPVNPPKPSTALETVAHRTVARVAADQSIVLLKNDGGLLPLAAGRIRTIAVFGPDAQTNAVAGGSYAVHARYGPTPFEAIRLYFGNGVTAAGSPADGAKADVAIVFAGASGQDELIAAVAKANPKTIVVMTAGSAVTMGKWAAKVPVILQAWFPGEEGSDAIADILSGAVNPSGRLPITIPTAAKDLPPEDSGLFPGY